MNANFTIYTLMEDVPYEYSAAIRAFTDRETADAVRELYTKHLGKGCYYSVEEMVVESSGTPVVRRWFTTQITVRASNLLLVRDNWHEITREHVEISLTNEPVECAVKVTHVDWKVINTSPRGSRHITDPGFTVDATATTSAKAVKAARAAAKAEIDRMPKLGSNWPE